MAGSMKTAMPSPASTSSSSMSALDTAASCSTGEVASHSSTGTAGAMRTPTTGWGPPPSRCGATRRPGGEGQHNHSFLVRSGAAASIGASAPLWDRCGDRPDRHQRAATSGPIAPEPVRMLAPYRRRGASNPPQRVNLRPTTHRSSGTCSHLVCAVIWYVQWSSACSHLVRAVVMGIVCPSAKVDISAARRWPTGPAQRQATGGISWSCGLGPGHRRTGTVRASNRSGTEQVSESNRNAPGSRVSPRGRARRSP